MRFTVELPDTTPEQIVNKIAQAVSDAGGNIDAGQEQAPVEEELGPEVLEPGMEIPGGVLDQPLPAGPPMTPGAAMSGMGAQALRPPGLELPPPPRPRRPAGY